MQRIVIVVSVTFLILCLGGGVFVYSVYVKATGPSLGAPDVAADGFLREFLVNRNDTRANGYVCRTGADLTEIRALRSDVIAREKQFNISVSVTWGPLAVRQSGGAADVTLTIKVDVPEANGATSESAQQWSLSLRQDSGWRVCGAHRAGT